MRTDELFQWAGVAAGLGLLLVVIGYAVRFSRRVRAIFPDAAQKYGLTAAERGLGNFFTGWGEEHTLRGASNGVPIEVVSRREARGRYTVRSTTITARIALPATPCTITVSRERPLHPLHLVRTDDPAFDAARFVRCDAPETLRALLTERVRAALLACPQHELQLTVTAQTLVLAWKDTPLAAKDLEAPLDVVLTIARDPPRSAPLVPAATTAVAPRRVVGTHDAGRAIGLSAEHLEANRVGRLHPEQIARVMSEGRADSVAALMGTVLFTAAGVAGGIYNYHDRMDPTLSAFVVPVWLGLLPASACVVGYLSVRRKRRARQRVLETHAPQVVEGPVSPSMLRGHGVQPQFNFTVAGRTFGSSAWVHAALTPGGLYRVYYVEDVVLGIEALRGPETPDDALDTPS